MPAFDANGYPVLQHNGIPFNIGGDYNLDSELNDHPVFGGTNINSVYSGANPAAGFFARCGGVSWRSQACRPTSPTPPAVLACGRIKYAAWEPCIPRRSHAVRTLCHHRKGRFHRPQFVDLDVGLHKTFKITESTNLRFSAKAQNLANHPNFDGVQADLNSSRFGQAELVDGGAGLFHAEIALDVAQLAANILILPRPAAAQSSDRATGRKVLENEGGGEERPPFRCFDTLARDSVKSAIPHSGHQEESRLASLKPMGPSARERMVSSLAMLPRRSRRWPWLFIFPRAAASMPRSSRIRSSRNIGK